MKAEQMSPLLRNAAASGLMALSLLGGEAKAETSTRTVSAVSYRTVKVEGIDIFYREAGDPKKSAVLLLHGFPASSHMFRELIPKLADEYHVIAPDYPGFGHSAVPPRTEFKYTFDNIAALIDKFTATVGLTKFAIYVQDYGSPVGFRIAAANPNKITALIVQNGNAYEEGLTALAAPLKLYGKARDKEAEKALRGFLTLEGTKFQYVTGASDPKTMSPDPWILDQALLDRPGIVDIQLDLFADYASNLKAYPTWHEYLRKYQPPTLIVWGKNDPFFGLQNIDGFRRDLKSPEVHLLDGGHFVLEERPDEIAGYIANFLGKTFAKR